MKKITSPMAIALVLTGIILPSAFVHAAATSTATSTPKVIHRTHPISHQVITGKAVLKPSMALRASGILTASTANSITISSMLTHGNTATTTKTYTTDSSTKFTKGGSEVTLSGLTNGDLVEIILRETGTNTFVVRSVTDTGLTSASADAKTNAKMNAKRAAMFKVKK